MFVREKYCERLRQLRKNKGLSQTEASEKFGASQKAFSHWECGDREPPLATLCAMAEFYGVTVDYLLGLSDER